MRVQRISEFPLLNMSNSKRRLDSSHMQDEGRASVSLLSSHSQAKILSVGHLFLLIIPKIEAEIFETQAEHAQCNE